MEDIRLWSSSEDLIFLSLQLFFCFDTGLFFVCRRREPGGY
jgi:hypothetical protein